MYFPYILVFAEVPSKTFPLSVRNLLFGFEELAVTCALFFATKSDNFYFIKEKFLKKSHHHRMN